MWTLGAGRYRVDARIADGAIGTVWCGVDTQQRVPVAVKVLQPHAAAQPSLVAAFRDEARILTELAHPSVVRAHDVLRLNDGRYALVLDLVSGADLRQRLARNGPLPPAVAADVVAQVATALSYVHGRGVVHGDIKPGNILVPVDGGPVRLTDFGVARRLPTPDRPQPSPRPAYATPEYVSPEVIGGAPPGPAADVYALGIVLFELLCGRTPFRGGDALDVLRRHMTCVPVPPAGLPEVLWRVISQCLAPLPEDRPGPAALAARLRAAEAELVGVRPLPLLDASALTCWPRAADRTAPVAPLSTRVTWVPVGAPGAADQRIVAVVPGVAPARSARRTSLLVGAAVVVSVLLVALLLAFAGSLRVGAHVSAGSLRVGAHVSAGSLRVGAHVSAGSLRVGAQVLVLPGLLHDGAGLLGGAARPVTATAVSTAGMLSVL